jgi:hypothetical protein
MNVMLPNGVGSEPDSVPAKEALTRPNIVAMLTAAWPPRTSVANT